MRWQKAARLVIAAAGLGTAAAIYFLSRERPAAVKPPVTLVADPNAILQGAAGQQERTDGDRVIGSVTYGGMRKYADGRFQWDRFTYKLANGMVMTADLVEGKGNADGRDQPAEFTMAGNVSFDGGERGKLAGDSATYDDRTGVATVPGAATFSRGKMTGTGTGGSYERDTGVFKLLADTKLTIPAAEDGGTPVEATSRAMTFVPVGKSMTFEGQARLVRAAETMTAETAVLNLSEDEQRFRSIQLRGQGAVMPAPGQASNLPEMQGDEILLSFYDNRDELQSAELKGHASMVQVTEAVRRSIAGREVTFLTAKDGKTLTRLASTGEVTVTLPASATTAARTITAGLLVASGNEKAGLTSAVFDSRVEFTESAAEMKRTGRAEKLTLGLKGQLDAIESADFERDAHFTSGDDITADADVAHYRIARGELELAPAARGPQKPLHASNGEVTVDASELVTMNLNTDALYARGDVRTSSQSTRQTGKPAAAGGTLFDSNSPWTGSASEFTYDPAKKSFEYVAKGTSRAEVKQTDKGDDSIVTANAISFLEESEDLHASGNVETTFSIARGGDGAKPSQYRMTAQTFDFSNAKRTASYSGAPSTLKSSTDEIRAARIVMTLVSGQRRLQQLESVDEPDKVRAWVQRDREVQGGRFVYDALKDFYEWWGTPLIFWERQSDGTCRKTNANYAEISGSNAPSFPGPPKNPASISVTDRLPCPASLPPSSPPQTK